MNTPAITKVGGYAFMDCTALTSVTLKKGCGINLYDIFYCAGAKDCTINYVDDNGNVVKTIKVSEL